MTFEAEKAIVELLTYFVEKECENAKDCGECFEKCDNCLKTILHTLETGV